MVFSPVFLHTDAWQHYINFVLLHTFESITIQCCNQNCLNVLLLVEVLAEQKKSFCSKWSWLEMFASSIWSINYVHTSRKKGVPLHAIVFFDWFAWFFSPYQGQYTQVIAFITKVYMTKIDFKQLYTVRPRDTRPQAARTLTMQIFE